jgi:lysophospholipase L1-like esterase
MAYYTDERQYFDELEQHNHLKKILCDGDSWFSIPDIANIPIQLDSQFDLSILCLADPGATLAELAGGMPFARLQRLLHEPQFGQHWDAILISSGGNDVLGPDIQRMLQPASGDQVQDYINNAAQEQVYATIRQRIEAILAVRDQSPINADTPVIFHSYSYMTPRNVAHRVLAFNVAGPWVYPALLALGITDSALQQAISRELTDRFYQLLQSIAADARRNFHVVDVRSVIAPVPASERDGQAALWSDEIHPNSAGFACLTEQGFALMLRQLGIV